MFGQFDPRSDFVFDRIRRGNQIIKIGAVLFFLNNPLVCLGNPRKIQDPIWFAKKGMETQRAQRRLRPHLLKVKLPMEKLGISACAQNCRAPRFVWRSNLVVLGSAPKGSCIGGHVRLVWVEIDGTGLDGFCSMYLYFARKSPMGSCFSREILTTPLFEPVYLSLNPAGTGLRGKGAPKFDRPPMQTGSNRMSLDGSKAAILIAAFVAARFVWRSLVAYLPTHLLQQTLRRYSYLD